MSDRDQFDKAFKKLAVELEEREAAEIVTEAVISGRLSIYLLAEKAIGSNLTLEQFTEALKIIVGKEIRTGRVDEESFELLTEYDHPNQNLLGEDRDEGN